MILKLCWSHFVEILSIKSDEARIYYANEATLRHFGTKELRRQILKKAYERREIADTRISGDSLIPFNVFKDPYFLDVLDLKENFLEADLEKAILAELEKFILEFGYGFTFVERQKPTNWHYFCTKASREQIELMELDKSGIAVAEYWTNLPPKALLEEKIRAILSEAQERLLRHKSLSSDDAKKRIDYFYETKDDESE